MKWYVLLMAVGNWVEVLFMWPVRLGVQLTSTWVGGDLSCKPLSLTAVLGPNVASMAVAALSVHVLLTAITGCHGNRLRHGLVIGLFLLLSLPFPVSKVRLLFFLLLLKLLLFFFFLFVRRSPLLVSSSVLF